MLPEKGYRVQFSLSGEAENESVNVKAYLPAEDGRQKIFDESFDSGPFSFKIEGEGFQRRGIWTLDEAQNHPEWKVHYRFAVLAKPIAWELDPELRIPNENSPELKINLQETEMIAYRHPEIEKLFQSLVKEDNHILSVIQKAYSYVAKIPTEPFKGSTSALTALVLQKASCNGKSRLMVAILRRAGIPARVVGGLVLEDRQKRTSHQWVEVNVEGQWITFDPTNNHFAKIPANYLKIYESDLVLFSHTKEIAFDWIFKIKSFLVPSAELHRLKEGKLNALNLFEWLQKAGVPLGIIKILLVIPIGALIATFFRNVVGLQTFGTFLPPLIAAAAQETGMVWGLLGFSFVILVIAVFRVGFEHLNLMHTPKLSAMLTVVVILLISLSLLSVKFAFIDLTHVTLFPIAILTLTSERFSLTIEERGIGKAFFILGQTLFVTAVCYFFMSSLFLQTSFLAFPELTLLVIGLNIWLGQWLGLRVLEIWRFRKVIFQSGAPGQ